jgi:outer membrane protein assembly factor BamD (BamD/ComL family)
MTSERKLVAPARYGMLALLALVAWSGCAPVPPKLAYVDVDAQFDRAVELRAEGQHLKAARAFKAFAASYDVDKRADYAQYLAAEEYVAAGLHEPAVDALLVLHQQFPHSAYLDKGNELAVECARHLLSGGSRKATEIVQTLADAAPFGDTAAKLHQELGDHFYERERFADAAYEYDIVDTESSDRRLAAKAGLQAAICEYRQIQRPARNAEHIIEAERRLRALRTADLDATDMRKVDELYRSARHLAAEYRMAMARFYLKQADVVAAVVYLREVAQEYGDTPYHAEAVDLLLMVQQETQPASE